MEAGIESLPDYDHDHEAEDHEAELLKATFAAAVVDRYIWSETDALRLRWPKSFSRRCAIGVQLRQLPARVFSDSPHLIAEGGLEVTTVAPFEIADGAYHLRLMPQAAHQRANKPPLVRDIPVYMARGRFSANTVADQNSRIIEAVTWVTQQGNYLYPQILKMALGRWSRVNWQVVDAARQRVDQAPGRQLLELVGLAGALCRFGENEHFHATARRQLEATIQKTSYELPPLRHPQWTEGDEICALTAQLLAGQLLPEHSFAVDGRVGRGQQAHAEAQIHTWIQQRAERGFSDWYDSASFEKIIVALSHLVDLAQKDDLLELAGVLLDKLFFMLALHNFHGICGAPQRRTTIPQVFGPRFDPLAGVSKLIWGQGVWNSHLAGLVSLLNLSAYVVPDLLQEIATDTTEAWFGERHKEGPESAAVEVVTFRTPAYQLSSARQDGPQAGGASERMWQASLTADAIVFTSHPGHEGLENEFQPNFWCGNCTLPQVAQWRNVLIALYELSATDPTHYTHAYFPAFAFDEYTVGEKWAFARCGDAFLALFAACGLEWVQCGDAAFRELRSHGRSNGWLCYLDQARPDFTFADFKAALLATPVKFASGTLSCTLPNSSDITLGLDRPLQVNGYTPAPAADFHFDTPYAQVQFGAADMIIGKGKYAVRLDFSSSI